LTRAEKGGTKQQAELAGDPMNFRITAPESRGEALRSVSVLHYLGFAIALFLTLAASVITGFAVHSGAQMPGIDVLQFAPEMRAYLNPEPVERAAYLAAVIASLPSVLLAIALARHWLRGIRGPLRAASLSGALSFCLCAPLAAVFVGSDFISYLMGGTPTAPFAIHFDPSSLLVVLCAGALALYVTNSYLHGRLTAGTRFYARAILLSRWTDTALAIATLLTVAALRIRTAPTVDQNWHFEPVFYSMTQVMAGKTLIADLPSQYGLFAEILRPLFAITGLSALKFTLVMTALQGVASFALLGLCRGVIRLNGVRLVAVLTLCWVVGSAWAAVMISLYGHEYFQVWPIRFLFPALSAFLFFAFRREGLTAGRVATLAVLAGLGILWNLDSGVPTAGALIAFLLIRAVLGGGGERLRNIGRLAIGIAAPVVVVAAFLQYLSLKAGGHIHLADWIKYQQIFYAAGFGMLPLPRQPHPWMAVLGLYLFGLTGGILAQFRRKPFLVWDIIFYLSVLGLGLFTYYQGRSHAVVLTFVVWPAIVIAFILADRALRAARAGVLPMLTAWSISPVLIFGVMMSLLWVLRSPNLLLMTAKEAWTVAVPRHGTVTSQNIAFIKTMVGADKSAVILSPAQALYYGETGLASDISGPSIAETILLADQRHVTETLKAHPVAHLFIQLDSRGQVPVLYRAAVSDYRAKAKTPAGLQYLVPRSKAANN
jgi:hypothetical protein